MKRCIRLSLVISLVAIVSACSGPSHVLVKKEHFEAADQCLLIQQSALAANRDHEHIAETLALLRESLELQRRGCSAVRERSEERRVGKGRRGGGVRGGGIKDGGG